MRPAPHLSALLRRPLTAAALLLAAPGVQAGVVFTSIYSFTGGNDGLAPEAGLVQGSDGYFYGTTAAGGGSGTTYYGDGTVFKSSTNGALITLHAFTGGSDGSDPEAGLVQGSDGEFYGTTYLGGDSSAGSVFWMSAQGALTNLCSFSSGGPEAPVIQASDGCLYGTTFAGGGPNEGTLFKLSTNGVLATLHSFTNGSDGAYPRTA